MAWKGEFKGLTVFGVEDDNTTPILTQRRVTLYGPQELSDKEKKKVAKMQKFLAKQQKKAEASKDKKAPKKEKKPAKKAVVDDFKYVAPKAGDKKEVTKGMPQAYQPAVVEDAWYSWWMKEGYLKPEYNMAKDKLRCPEEDDKFTIIIPPPNVTGTLHLGHALTNAIEDTLVRWNRQLGKQTLWNPGCDHAGIATQSVVEKKLWREEKLRRTDLGREKFLERVWDWKNEKGGRIYEQLRGLGASCDWDREAFTMSDRCCKAVTEAFVRMHEDGLIFRSNRLVNWSCKLNSAISDIEVDKIELSGKTMLSVPGYDDKVEFGVITSFAYKFAEGDGELVVATTRPETMLGDVAVAVHPNDERYKHLVGKKLIHPFIKDREMVVVADDFVEIGFGTGAVKITPAHDQNDFECGQRHELPVITVITKDGVIADGCGDFSGMKRFDARSEVIKRLKEADLYRGVADNPMVVPKCSRSGDIIEPLLVPQWFCSCKEMGARAVEAVRNKELKLIPEHHEKIWYNWLEDSRDWCISRQLWWGHRIPAYFVSIEGQEAGQADDNKYWVSAHTEAEALSKAAKRFDVAEAKISLKQDEDVLDTWFSSGLFPISIFNWPDVEDEEFKKFYPGHLLETGYDILFFWVARMVMMCTYLTGQLPFKEVYLHSMVRDKEGRKMSKSLGNVVDPMDVRNGITLETLHERLKQGNLDPREHGRAIEGQKRQFPDGIKECGVDALRFALCSFLTPGRDINLDVQRVFGYRTFCNKVYNAFKLVSSKLGDDYKPLAWDKLTGHEAPEDLWILSRLSSAVTEVNKGLKTYDFPAATTAVYSLWLYDFANSYLEMIKPVFQSDGDAKRQAAVRNCLFKIMDNGLRLLSPFMPFLAEELWQRLPTCRGENDLVDPPSITVAAFPVTPRFSDEASEAVMTFVLEVVKSTRSIKAEYLRANQQPKVYIRCLDDDSFNTLEQFAVMIGLLTFTEAEVLRPNTDIPEGCVSSVSSDLEIFLMVKGMVDVEQEVKKLVKKQSQEQARMQKLEQKIASESYKTKVPADVQAADAKKLEDLKTSLALLEADVKRYQSLN
eukprot:TRINITY_DN11021_c0_g1_i1.p1 TRINITY_DN11021_c0_g1~~TRINITY_DN11021_c0_g1_i1.p1  ORF type:complete len:1070 (+),score=320.61 TRINITY_DN11021_c0_g1_i1:39-3248(+)